jgi:hypothetical protein
LGAVLVPSAEIKKTEAAPVEVVAAAAAAAAAAAVLQLASMMTMPLNI